MILLMSMIISMPIIISMSKIMSMSMIMSMSLIMLMIIIMLMLMILIMSTSLIMSMKIRFPDLRSIFTDQGDISSPRNNIFQTKPIAINLNEDLQPSLDDENIITEAALPGIFRF